MQTFLECFFVLHQSWVVWIVLFVISFITSEFRTRRFRMDSKIHGIYELIPLVALWGGECNTIKLALTHVIMSRYKTIIQFTFSNNNPIYSCWASMYCTCMHVCYSQLKCQASESSRNGLPTFFLCLSTIKLSLALGEASLCSSYLHVHILVFLKFNPQENGTEQLRLTESVYSYNIC